jgi:hypothetical protein
LGFLSVPICEICGKKHALSDKHLLQQAAIEGLDEFNLLCDAFDRRSRAVRKFAMLVGSG